MTSRQKKCECFEAAYSACAADCGACATEHNACAAYLIACAAHRKARSGFFKALLEAARALAHFLEEGALGAIGLPFGCQWDPIGPHGNRGYAPQSGPSKNRAFVGGTLDRLQVLPSPVPMSPEDSGARFFDALLALGSAKLDNSDFEWRLMAISAEVRNESTSCDLTGDLSPLNG